MVAFNTSMAPAATLYVDLNSANPVPPFADWSTAATNIQDAIDVSSDGDLILVTNGVYQTGGRTVNGSALTNRVVVDKAVTVQSVNGSRVTIIEGYQIPGSFNDDSAVRCVYLTDGAELIGFTVANGATLTQFSSESDFDGSGGGIWCQSTNVTVSDCLIVSNACSFYGAGVYAGTLDDCQINNNTNQNTGSSGGGGGAAYSVLLGSTINSNYVFSVEGKGSGGAFMCILSNCVVAENSMGGVGDCTLNNCTVENNTNTYSGGGAVFSILCHSIVCNNWTGLWYGGGAYDCVLNNCTISNNWAGQNGGGVYNDSSETNGPGQNNVVVGNIANRTGGGIYFAGNLTNWMFISNSAASDGGGAYLSSSQSTLNNCTFSGNSSGGNGGGVCGTYPSLIAASNCTFSGNTAVGNGGGAYGAALNNCSVVGNQAGNGGGAYGALNNCSVVDNRAGNGGGVYGTTSNCTVKGNIATTNGGGLYLFFIGYIPSPFVNCAFTSNFAANGGGAYVGSGASGGVFSNSVFLANFATISGGGVQAGTLSRCIIQNNSAGANGGGTYSSSITNCLLTGNSAAYGGGAYGGFINNSTIVSNTATSNGGGTYFVSGATSSIVYDNSAPAGSNFENFEPYNYCCTTPMPTIGNSNITNGPVFVNFAAGNFRLQTNSPCINAGSGSPGSIDLDGRPRVVGGRIDIGAYEFQGPGIGEFVGWLQQYGLPTDGSVDYADLDGTGFNVYQDWIAGLNPTNALSVLAMLTPVSTNNPVGLVVSWESVGNRTYFLQGSTNLGTQPAFSSIQSNIVGQAGKTSYTDTNAVGNGPFFYRVGVQQ